MSSWSTLNVAYDGDWEEPDLFLRDIRGKPHPYDGFDYLLSAFTRDDRALPLFREIALEHGDPEFLVEVEGSGTTGAFAVQQVDADGEVIQSFGRKTLDDSWQMESYSDMLDRVGEETGYRPSLGGNYE